MEETSDVSSNENDSKPVDFEKSAVSSNENASKPVDNEECSHASSQLIQSEPCDDEVQSPLVIPKGSVKS